MNKKFFKVFTNRKELDDFVHNHGINFFYEINIEVFDCGSIILKYRTHNGEEIK